MRIELATSSLPRKCSTTELQQQEWILSIYSDFTLHYGAEDGTQTRDPQLGRLMLYRLSYFRKIVKLIDGLIVFSFTSIILYVFLWAVMDSNHRRLRQLSYSQPHLATLETALLCPSYYKSAG